MKAARESEKRSQEISSFLDSLYENKIEISPFFSRNDVTVKINDFLDEVDKNIFLRMYIPNNRFQAEQFESLLKTFERYLRQVETKNFNIEARSSGSGTTYVFCSAENEQPFDNLEETFQRFDQFMKLCRDSPEHAAALLQTPGLTSAEVRFLVAKYARDYQRIMIDLKHEFQQKMLLLSQRFDLESLNFNEDRLIDPLKNSGPSTLLDISGNTGSITLSFGDMSNSAASLLSQDIGKTINSGIVYNKNDDLLLELINRNAEKVNAIQLRSDLDQSKTTTMPEVERKISRGRLTSFLFSLASKTADEAAKRSVHELIDYVIKGLVS